MSELFSESVFDDSVDAKKDIDEKSIMEIARLEAEKIALRNKDFAQNIEQRKMYANLVFSLVCIWLTMVLFILIACGMERMKISDTVLSILIGTTTANVCGFLLFVVKFLFNVEPVAMPVKKKKKK